MSNLKYFENKKGFTLIEIVLVVAIISILSVGVVAVINPLTQINKANDAKRKADLSTIQKVIEQYYQDMGRYPPVMSANDFRIKGLNGQPVNWGSSWSPYINLMPKDPKSNKKYVYYSTPDGQAYYLYASMDSTNDKSLCNQTGTCSGLLTNGIPGNSCGDICNFGITSPNVSP